MNKHTSKNQKVDRYVLGMAPTFERQRHQGGFRREYVKADGSAGIAVQRYRARWATPLDLYRDRQIIDRAQHQAGLRFGQAYRHAVSGKEACQERARLFGTPEESASMSDSFVSDTVTQEALDYIEQTYAVLSSDTVNVVIDVCAHAQPVTTLEALNKLRRGLGRLTHEWGMTAAEMCQFRKG